MTSNMKIYWIQAITPLHVGSGRGVGFIDMPIMREKVTNWPMVPGSAVKGVMRDYFTIRKEELKKEEPKIEELINAAFGKPEDDAGNANSGSLVLTDARIVCLPVRSLYGTFAYTTSPLVLERLGRDMIASGISELPPTPKPGDGEALLPGSKLYAEGKAFLEDLDFEAKPDDTTANWAECLAGSIFPKEADATWKQIFKERFAVISDNCFNFLSKTGTEVAAHIKIDDDKKIVAKHALWYEEALPAEAILAGVAWCDRVYKSKDIKDIDETKIFRTFCPAAGLDLQIGGRATVGKGRVRCLFTGS